MSTFVLRDIIKHNFSQDGVCGALLLRENFTQPIMAMHVAGSGEDFRGDGYAVPLTREFVADLVKRESAVQLDKVTYGPIEDAKFVYDDTGTVYLAYLGSLEPAKVPYIPTKSKLVRSILYGEPELVTDMEPAIMNKGDWLKIVLSN